MCSLSKAVLGSVEGVFSLVSQDDVVGVMSVEVLSVVSIMMIGSGFVVSIGVVRVWVVVVGLCGVLVIVVSEGFVFGEVLLSVVRWLPGVVVHSGGVVRVSVVLVVRGVHVVSIGGSVVVVSVVVTFPVRNRLVVGKSFSVVGKSFSVVGKSVGGDSVCHLSTNKDLGESKTDGVAELVVVLVVPLGHSVHHFVVHILSVDNQVVLNVENEVPGVLEGLGHGAEFVQVSADGGLALFELLGHVVDNVSEVFNGVQDRVEGGDLELVDDAANALPSVLGISEALNAVGNFSLDGSSEETFEDLAHAEESEVHVG